MGIVHEGSGMAPAFRLFSYFWKIIAFPESVFWASKGGVRFYFNGKFRQMEKKVSHLHSHQFIATVIPFLLTFECLTVLASMLISRVLAVSAQTLALVWRWVGTEAEGDFLSYVLMRKQEKKNKLGGVWILFCFMLYVNVSIGKNWPFLPRGVFELSYAVMSQ